MADLPGGNLIPAGKVFQTIDAGAVVFLASFAVFFALFAVKDFDVLFRRSKA